MATSSGLLSQSAKIAQEQASGGAPKNGFGPLTFTEKHKQESGGLMLTFVEFEYKRPDFNSRFTPKATGTQIALPIPYNLDTNYQTQWNTPDAGAWTQMVANEGGEILRNTIKNGFEMPALSMTDGKYQSLASGLGRFASAVGTDILAQNRLFQVAGQGAGIARNPFLAALFEGVQFRTFNMQFKLYPKSKEEADIIRNIIKAFKYGMHPSYQSFGGLKNALFNYPYIYKPAFTKPEYLFDIGYCIIKNISPMYHSEGAPHYFESDGNKIPAFVTLAIEFQELEIITKDSLSGSTLQDDRSGS